MSRVIRSLLVLGLLVSLTWLPARAEPRPGFHLENRVPADSWAFLSHEDVGSWEGRIVPTGMIGRVVPAAFAAVTEGVP